MQSRVWGFFVRRIRYYTDWRLCLLQRLTKSADRVLNRISSYRVKRVLEYEKKYGPPDFSGFTMRLRIPVRLSDVEDKESPIPVKVVFLDEEDEELKEMQDTLPLGIITGAFLSLEVWDDGLSAQISVRKNVTPTLCEAVRSIAHELAHLIILAGDEDSTDEQTEEEYLHEEQVAIYVSWAVMGGAKFALDDINLTIPMRDSRIRKLDKRVLADAKVVLNVGRSSFDELKYLLFNPKVT